MVKRCFVCTFHAISGISECGQLGVRNGNGEIHDSVKHNQLSFALQFLSSSARSLSGCDLSACDRSATVQEITLRFTQKGLRQTKVDELVRQKDGGDQQQWKAGN